MIFVCHNIQMHTELLSYLVAVYAFISLGMFLISWFIYRGSKTSLMRYIFLFWAVNLVSLVITGFVARYPDPRIIALGALSWPPIYILMFNICREFVPNIRIPFWSYAVITVGYIVSGILLMLNIPFHISTIPGVSSLAAMGSYMVWKYCRLSKDRKMSNLEKVYIFLMVSFLVHMMDWPFLRLNHEAAPFGYTYFIFNIIGFACIMPALALEKLGKNKADELEKLVEERTQQLVQQSKLSALGEMAAGVAHEINNPLSIIVGRSAQMIKKIEKGQELTSAQILENLKSVEQTAFRISRIVKALRDFSRQSPNEPIRHMTIQAIFDEVLPLCNERFSHSGVNLDIGGDLESKVNVHGLQVSQVFLNLLNNAFDAVESLPQKWIHIEVKKTEHEVFVSFIDSGHGISHEIQQKIMLPFFTTKDIGKGTGLGLSISKGIIEKHEGRIYLDVNQPNTTFVVALPN